MFALFVVGMVLGFAAFFAGEWCLLVWLFSRIGGWSRLAQRYAATQQPSGTIYSRQTAELGLMRYRSCLTVGMSPEGLYLKVWPMFRLGHPPLLIPWADVSQPKEVSKFFHQHAEVALGSPPTAVLRLPVQLLDPLRQAQR